MIVERGTTERLLKPSWQEILKHTGLTQEQVAHMTDQKITDWAAFLSEWHWWNIPRTENKDETNLAPEHQSRPRAEAVTFNSWARLLRELRGALGGPAVPPAGRSLLSNKEEQELLKIFYFVPELPPELQQVVVEEGLTKITAAALSDEEIEERAETYAERYMANEKASRAEKQAMPGTDQALRAAMGEDKAGAQEVTAASALYDEREHQLQAIRARARGEGAEQGNPLGEVDLDDWEPELGADPN